MAAQPEPVVSNSSPLIALATIGRLALVKGLLEEIAIPRAVYEEVVIQGQGEPGSKEVAEAKWIRTIPVKDQLAADLLHESLDLGESEAIVLAQELGARYVLLDDELARRKADLIGLPVAVHGNPLCGEEVVLDHHRLAAGFGQGRGIEHRQGHRRRRSTGFRAPILVRRSACSLT